MDKITHEVRIANWRSIIEQCQARPEGQSAKQWLADNGISEKNYYYWQRKVKQETFALITSNAAPVTKPEPVAFADLPLTTLYFLLCTSLRACYSHRHYAECAESRNSLFLPFSGIIRPAYQVSRKSTEEVIAFMKAEDDNGQES